MKIALAILFFITTNCFAQNDSIHKNKDLKDTTIYDLVAVQEKPSFPGGTPEMMLFLNNNIHIQERYQTKVVVSFIVETDGAITNVKMYKGDNSCYECNKEAIRVVKKMPKWLPGKNNGTPVRVSYILPIMIRG